MPESGAQSTEAYAYQGLNETCLATQYVNRFNGEVYNIRKGHTRTTPATTPDAGSLYHNGTTFVEWTPSADSTAIATKEQANNLFLAGTKVYKLMGASYTEVQNATEFNDSGATFHLFTPVDTFLTDTSKSVMETVATKANATDNFFQLEAQRFTKVTVYIWLEGQDVDCEDSIASHAFSVAFKFNANYVQQGA